MGFHARIDLREGADRAGDRAGRDFFSRGDQTLFRAGKLGIGIGQLEAEGDRLGMDAVRTADGRRHPVLIGAGLQRGQQAIDVGDQEVGATRELDVEAGVEHVRRRHALVHEARFRPDDLGQMRQEGDDVVLGLALDLVDAVDVKGGILGLGPDGLCRFLGNGAKFRQRVGRMRLDLEPDLEAGLRLPNGGHFGTGIAGDHGHSQGFGGLRRALADRDGGGNGRNWRGSIFETSADAKTKKSKNKENTCLPIGYYSYKILSLRCWEMVHDTSRGMRRSESRPYTAEIPLAGHKV